MWVYSVPPFHDELLMITRTYTLENGFFVDIWFFFSFVQDREALRYPFAGYSSRYHIT